MVKKLLQNNAWTKRILSPLHIQNKVIVAKSWYTSDGTCRIFTVMKVYERKALHIRQHCRFMGKHFYNQALCTTAQLTGNYILATNWGLHFMATCRKSPAWHPFCHCSQIQLSFRPQEEITILCYTLTKFGPRDNINPRFTAMICSLCNLWYFWTPARIVRTPHKK